jgi:hypothetical protein
MKIEIENLTEAQQIALEDLLATWVQLGRIGSSRWTNFYADGDGNFKPKITVDGHEAQLTDLLSHEQKWPTGSSGSCQIDFDWIAWKLREQREGK